MKHKQDAIEVSEEIIKSHLNNGCSSELALKSAITTVKIMLHTGLAPISKSLYQRALNYLTKDIPKATIEEIESGGELVKQKIVDEAGKEEYEHDYDEFDDDEDNKYKEAGIISVYRYFDQTFHIATWHSHSTKTGKEIYRIY